MLYAGTENILLFYYKKFQKIFSNRYTWSYCILELVAIRNWLTSIIVDFHSIATRVLSTLKIFTLKEKDEHTKKFL